MIFSPGDFRRNASASSAVMKSPAMNSPRAVDEEAPVRVAVPRDADVGAFSATTRAMMSRRFSSMSGLASWFGNRPVDLEAQPRRLAGQPVEEPRSDQAGHAAAGVEHDVERLDDGRIDERHDLVDVGVEQVAALERPPGGAGGSGMVCRVTMSRISPMPASPDSGNASRAHHLDAVVLARVVRGGDLRAAVEPVADHREVEHVGARIMP